MILMRKRLKDCDIEALFVDGSSKDKRGPRCVVRDGTIENVL